MIKPSYFDASKKYPVLIYLYNGPHLQLVNNSYMGGAALWMMEAAERGYLVWTVDGHGSDHHTPDVISNKPYTAISANWKWRTKCVEWSS